jgi:AraC family transcriptional regulator, regulatory protein of adaptative response / DNA-3-methyladenine glycosylase II
LNTMSENGVSAGRSAVTLRAMNVSPINHYRAMQARDARFDGVFFVGVRTTKIYCRPICRVKLPLEKNCTFHVSAAAAERAGFRPCLKCRPECAPGFAAWEGSATLARAAARMMESGEFASVESIAKKLGVTSRHLRRIFEAEHGVSPIRFAQTQRLLLAKQLLTESRLSVTDVAFASGFASVRRMNALFAAQYGFSPSRLRRDAGDESFAADDGLTLRVSYRPPYDWVSLLAFLAQRTIPGVEHASNDRYCRVLRLKTSSGADVIGWISVTPIANALQVTLSPSLVPECARVLALVKRVFDVNAHPDLIAKQLGAIAKSAPGLRVPGAFDGFELAVRAVLGQQVTVAAARTLATRLVNAFGEALRDEARGFPDTLTRTFPQAHTLAQCETGDVAQLGIVRARADAIIALAKEVASGRLDLSPTTSFEEASEKMQAIKGIGPWTAQYIAMRALSWPDAFPPRDVAILNALDLPNTSAGQRAADALAQRWQPWRSYAVLHLWKSLEKKS